nr:hypothetical protein BdHM001_36270 [Bdellovibrio sp. HM001]
MKERPILFNAEDVRAILDGKKTQTRRVLKPQPEPCDHLPYEGYETAPTEFFETEGEWACKTCGNGMRTCKEFPFVKGIRCPYGKPGDKLWARETFLPFDLDWRYPGRPHDLRDGPWPNVAYEADQDHDRNDCLKWRPSIHMPRWASRITLKVKNIRIERLQDISEEDAKAEGVLRFEHVASEQCIAGDLAGRTQGTSPHVLAFASLWDGITTPDTQWKQNPWVWVIEFERVK